MLMACDCARFDVTSIILIDDDLIEMQLSHQEANKTGLNILL